MIRACILITAAASFWQERVVHQHVEQVVEVHIPMSQDRAAALRQ